MTYDYVYYILFLNVYHLSLTALKFDPNLLKLLHVFVEPKPMELLTMWSYFSTMSTLSNIFHCFFLIDVLGLWEWVAIFSAIRINSIFLYVGRELITQDEFRSCILQLTYVARGLPKPLQNWTMLGVHFFAPL